MLVKSLFDRLHRPTASELSHKQKIDRNLPPKEKKRSRGSCSSDPIGSCSRLGNTLRSVFLCLPTSYSA